MNVESDAYTKLGVSAEKADVDQAAKALNSGLFPQAFCRVMPDIFGGDPDRCVLSHSDGAGTKSIVAYLLYRHTGDASYFEGIAHDALVMNVDDMLCSGATSNFTYVSVINRNSHRVGGDVIEAVIRGTLNSIDKLAAHGIEIEFCGGETADVGDIVRSVLVDGALTTRMDRASIVKNELVAGHRIIALSSAGSPASYEELENSGIAANGLTLARHALLDAEKIPAIEEISDDARDAKNSYKGEYGVDDELPGSSLTVGEALLSPTRSFAPIIRDILSDCAPAVSGIFHLSGGGHFKSLKFAQGVRIVKSIPNEIPALFSEIQRSTNLSWMEMARIFNLGWRMEVYCEPSTVKSVIEAAKQYNVDAKEIGFVDAGITGQRDLEITFQGQTESVRA